MIFESFFELFFLVASQNQRARHRNVIFDGIAGDSQCKYLTRSAPNSKCPEQFYYQWSELIIKKETPFNAKKVSQSFCHLILNRETLVEKAVLSIK